MANHLIIDLSDFRLDVLERGQPVRSYQIGLGKEDTPTPLGEYYIVWKVRRSNPNTVYGAIVMGVSAFSEQLTDWPGGGQVGIHGTNDPKGSIGKRVSHGCIRLKNEDILELTQLAPMGTPVMIQQ
jgi:lipoprotein-anchoring transpeptidase ErfK/SrfK